MINNLASETTDLMSAWGAIIGGGATVIAATAGVAAAVVAIRTLKSSKRDSRNRSRPMVGALLALGKNPKDPNAYLIIRNYGQSVAYAVEIWFEPNLVPSRTLSGKDSFVPSLLRRYSKPIKTWMPGVETRNAWFFDRGGKDEDGHSINDEPIPEVVTVVIRYSDGPHFWDRSNTRYRDEFVLDVANVRGELITTRSDDPHKLQISMAKSAKQIAKSMESAAKSLSKIEFYSTPDAVKAAKAAEHEEGRITVDGALLPLGVKELPVSEPAS